MNGSLHPLYLPRLVWYCSEECQRQDWGGHKEVCRREEGSRKERRREEHRRKKQEQKKQQGKEDVKDEKRKEEDVEKNHMMEVD